MYKIVSENELYHWDKGSQSSKHKYIDRKMKNGRWVYIYPNDQYKKAKREAYLAKGRSEAERSGYGAMNSTRAYQKVNKAINDRDAYVKSLEAKYGKGNIDKSTKSEAQHFKTLNREVNKSVNDANKTYSTTEKNKKNAKSVVSKIENSIAYKIEQGKRKLKKYLNRGVKTKIKEPKTSNKTEKVNLSELEKQGYKKNTEKGNSQKKRKKGLRLPNGTYIRFRTKK